MNYARKKSGILLRLQKRFGLSKFDRSEKKFEMLSTSICKDLLLQLSLLGKNF